MLKNGKILITDEVDSSLIEGLSLEGFVVDYKPEILPGEVLSVIQQYTGLIVNSKVHVDREMMDRAVNLKFVCRAGSGLEVIDLDYAKQKKIIAMNSPEGNRNAVAEFALGALLNLMRNISKADRQVRNLEWKREENRGLELSGRTVGLIAFGNTAQAFAKLMRGFDVKVMAYDKYYHGFTNEYVSEVSIEEIFRQADILSLHLPLTAETTYMIDYAFLSSFNKPFYLLNTSRGKVLQTAGLLKCIAEGSISGAALDVLENEKINYLSAEEKRIFDELIVNGKLSLSPHIAGWTQESKRKIAEVLLAKIKNI